MTTDRRHPNIYEALAPWAEAQTLHLVSVYANPMRYANRRMLANDFVDHMRRAPNVKLHMVEVAYGDRPFEFATGPDDVALRTKDIVWHKENALNVGISRLPADWKYAAYMDCDFHVTRHDWALSAVHALQHWSWVQLFSGYTFMGPDHRPLRNWPGFAFAYRNYYKGDIDRHVAEGVLGKTPASNGASTDDSPMKGAGVFGAPGGGWAFTRQAFDAVGGLLDVCILGAGDHYMALGLAGHSTRSTELQRHPSAYQDAILRWQERAKDKIQGSVSYIEAHATHGWHGDIEKRAYRTRWQILRDHDFDPNVDIVKDWQGLWQWRGNKPLLRDEVTQYFSSRSEDSDQCSVVPLF